MVKIEVSKRYTACPLFADVHEERCKVAKKNRKRPASASSHRPGSLPWHSPTVSGNRSDRMR